MLQVNEIFHSLQGEGSMVGTPMTFVRLTGCNLRCPFCDTARAFTEGTYMSIADIIEKIDDGALEWVCLTGGEPLIQSVVTLVKKLKRLQYRVALETNGTQLIYDGLFSHITVSPKNGSMVIDSSLELADDVKFIIADPNDYNMADAMARSQRWELRDEGHLFLQPASNDPAMIQFCVDKALEDPKWRVSLQIHKLIGIK